MSVHINYKLRKDQYLSSIDPYVNIVINVVKKKINPIKIDGSKAKVIDIGCGRGEILKGLNKLNYDCYGIDFDEECVSLSKMFGDVRCAGINKIDQEFDNNYFDFVILSHVLEHVSNPKEAISKILYISKNDILIIVPNLCSFKTVWRNLRNKITYVNHGHLFGWDASHLLTFLEITCNLKIVRWYQDQFFIPNKILNLLNIIGLGDYVGKKLIKLFPNFSNSLILLCKKKVCDQETERYSSEGKTI